jgi:hypothetical protein
VVIQVAKKVLKKEPGMCENAPNCRNNVSDGQYGLVASRKLSEQKPTMLKR